MKVCIIIPTYNEKENISNILNSLLETFKEIKTHDMSVLVVDDNSPDKTYEIVNEFNKSHSNISLLLRAKKEGLGAAYIQGINHAINNLNNDIIFQMDADMSHDPKLIPIFLKEIENNDLVIGSRYIKGGDFKNWPKYRKIISKGANMYGQFLLGLKVKDISSGFRCYKKEIIQKIDFSKFENLGYSFLEELLFMCAKSRARIKEIPFVFVDRTKGKTKLNKKEMKNFFVGILKLRIKHGKA